MPLEAALAHRDPFVYACENCSTEDLMTIISIKGKPDDIYHGFFQACVKGRKDNAEWLYNTYKPIASHKQNEYAFILVCSYGHLEVAQWLYNISIREGKPIDIHADAEMAFDKACTYGRLNVAKWLHDTAKNEPNGKPIYAHVGVEYSFWPACHCGHKDVAKWLYDLSKSEGQPIDIDAEDDRNSTVIEWLRAQVTISLDE